MKSKIVKSVVFSALALSLMGNSQCSSTPEQSTERQLRRRVQMGKIDAPPIELPQSFGGKKFDFAYVANMQMYDILRKTQSFSTANVDPNAVWDPSDLSTEEQATFNSCDDSQQAVVYSAKTGQQLFAPMGKKTFSSSAACLIDMPQGVVTGSILDFQLTSGGGLSLGLTGVKFLQALDFSFEKYDLSVTMKVIAPLQIGEQPLGTTIKNSYGKKMSVGASLNFGAITLGPKYYFQSPLAGVVNDGFTQAVSELRDNWTANEAWYAMVLRSCDKYIYVNGGYGSDANLKVGDILEVRNVSYEWQGDACHSRLMGDMALQAVAYAKVISVGRNMSAAEIIEHDTNYPHLPDRIYPGSRVYLKKTVEQVQADLASAQQKTRKK